MQNKKRFYLYTDSLDSLKFLTKEQIGDFTLAILTYQTTGKLPDGLEKIVEAVLHPIIQQFKRDEENYKKACERNAINGSKGGRPPKTEEKQKKPTETENNPVGFLGTQNNPQKPALISDTDKDTDKDKKRDYISPMVPLSDVDPKVELQKMKKQSEGSYQIWQMMAKEQGVEFTEDEWNALRGLAMANPKLQPFQITAMIIQLHDWAQQGLDIKQAILDYAQKAPGRFNSLKQPFMKKATDAKGNPVYGQTIVEQRKRIIEQEKSILKQNKPVDNSRMGECTK